MGFCFTAAFTVVCDLSYPRRVVMHLYAGVV